tara:strand:- start:264 stop:452 length:189 start_codon:yes stop_codon:yes gene_type:complete
MVAEKIIKLKSSNLKIINKTHPEYDPKKRQPDIALAIKNLSWRPQVEIDLCLKRNIKYFTQR